MFSENLYITNNDVSILKHPHIILVAKKAETEISFTHFCLLIQICKRNHWLGRKKGEQRKKQTHQKIEDPCFSTSYNTRDLSFSNRGQATPADGLLPQSSFEDAKEVTVVTGGRSS